MIERILVAADLVASSEAAMREAGSAGHELFVLWSGRVDDDAFHVATRHVPRQVSYKTTNGCGVRVDAPALHELNVWLYENGEVLAVQIHSHPTEAYHSQTDDAYPIVTTEGGVSLVVADFCRHGIVAPSTAAYRLERGRWSESLISIEVE